jgi:hypothetical protein
MIHWQKDKQKPARIAPDGLGLIRLLSQLDVNGDRRPGKNVAHNVFNGGLPVGFALRLSDALVNLLVDHVLDLALVLVDVESFQEQIRKAIWQGGLDPGFDQRLDRITEHDHEGLG